MYVVAKFTLEGQTYNSVYVRNECYWGQNNKVTWVYSKRREYYDVDDYDDDDMNAARALTNHFPIHIQKKNFLSLSYILYLILHETQI